MDWNKALKPLFRQYAGQKHPLEFKNLYQLLVMVILAARDSDRNINARAPELFRKFPSFKQLAKASPEDLYPFISGITNFRNKSIWLTNTAKAIQVDANIPRELEGLTQCHHEPDGCSSRGRDRGPALLACCAAAGNRQREKSQESGTAIDAKRAAEELAHSRNVAHMAGA
jgi:hypothetical protein